MSNVSTISPYERITNCLGKVAKGANITASGVVTVAKGIHALAKWLKEESEKEKAAVEQLKDKRRMERMDHNTPEYKPHEFKEERLNHSKEPAEITSCSLYLKEPAEIVQSAEKLGFRLEPHQTELSNNEPDTFLLMKGPNDERLCLERSNQGPLIVSDTGQGVAIKKIMRQHTLDKVKEHMVSKNMDIKTATLKSGEIQIQAREKVGQSGGNAQVSAQVRNDGSVWVDVDGIKGSRCETLVADLADAMNGKVTDSSKKEAYFQLPGESTKVKTKV